MLNETKIPTIAERETALDRVAIARCLCRTDGKYPSESEIVKERSRMAMSAAQGEPGHIPPLTAGDANAWLRANGLYVPAPNKSANQRNADDKPAGTIPKPPANFPNAGKQ